MNDENIVLIVDKYRLEPLREVRQDDISSFLGNSPGVYICDCPEAAWYNHFNFEKKQGSGSAKRKHYIFRQMGERSKWLSPTCDVPTGKFTANYQCDDILHLAYASLPSRFGQILQTILLFRWLLIHRKEYEYCLVYNFYLPTFFAPLVIKLLFGKRLYVDYEDDYTKIRKDRFKNFFENILKKTVNGALCINEGMMLDFSNKPICVLNVCSDLEYLKTADFSIRDDMIFLFSGTLDEIRGVELIPFLVESLRKKIKNFKIIVSGAGTLQSMVQNWTYPEVHYLGFLNSSDYEKIISKADACLVLQKPDHPFSLGSFPSKIDYYAEYKKPIFILK